MVKVFLDTNWYFDLAKRNKEKSKLIKDGLIFISALSTHILFYSFKLKVPDEEINRANKQFSLVPLSQDILNKALDGPTSDLEDNIQLHSAAEVDCDLFLTNDQSLLKMRFFGKTEILSVPKHPK